MNVNDTFFTNITQLENHPNYSVYNVCMHAPPHIVSDGYWVDEHKSDGSPLRSSFPVFQFQAIVIFAITQACHFLLKRLNLPMLISQITAGLILGPSLRVLEKYKMMLFPFGSQDNLATVTAIGYSLYCYEVGVKMDFSMLKRTGRKGWAIGFFGMVSPLCVAFASQSYFTSQAFDEDRSREVLVIMMSHSLTSFSVIASILDDLKILNSELGRLALSSALVADMLSNTFSILATFIEGANFITFLERFVPFIALVIFIAFVCRPAMFWIVRHTPEGRQVNNTYINIIIGIVLVLASSSMLLKVEIVLLPFIFGLATPEGPPLGSALIKRIHVFGTELLLPIYLTTCALKVDFTQHYSPQPVLTTVYMVLLIHGARIVAYFACSVFCKLPIRDALALALILNCKGFMEVILFSSALDKMDIHPQTFALMIISIMILISIVHIAVKYLYDPSRKYAGYQKRNIFSLKPNSGLRVLVCIHKQHHTTHITNALDLFYPTSEDPMIVDAIHLIELVGRSTPIFISHKLQKVVDSSENSYSENIIIAFNLFELDKQGAASVNTYTAVSPLKFMHEDVCILALDKLASIIILPFHRKWSTCGGTIENEDKNIRSLNCMVLERAPCSVGILVSRVVHPRDSSPLRLAMIFLGGKDDREALCLANRAARDTSIHLVVYHLVTNVSKIMVGNTDMDTMLDKAVLKDVMQANSDKVNVKYKEIAVDDGLQTASILREMADENDFFIVGRRHGIKSPQTSGLGDWSEFSELGLIGDYLASTDLNSRSSVLVVQQQQVSLKSW